MYVETESPFYSSIVIVVVKCCKIAIKVNVVKCYFHVFRLYERNQQISVHVAGKDHVAGKLYGHCFIQLLIVYCTVY